MNKKIKKTKKPEKMYETGNVFQIVGQADGYMFCQVASNKFALINMTCGNRYIEMVEYRNSIINHPFYPFSFIKTLAGKNSKVKPA